MKFLKLIAPILLLLPTITFSQSKVTEQILRKMFTLAENGQADKALKISDSIRNTHPTKDSNYVYLIMASAEINMKAFNCEAAIRDNEELSQLQPSLEIQTLPHIARFKKYLGDFDGSIAASKRIMEIDPNNELAYNNLANTYLYAGKYPEAIKTLNSNPNTERLPTEYYFYALAYLKTNQLDSAKINIDKFLSLENSNQSFEAYKCASQIYETLGDKKKSCEYITMANENAENSQAQLEKQPEKVKHLYLMKHILKEIEETKKLKKEHCK